MIKRTSALVAVAALASSALTPVFAQKESSFPPAAAFNGSEKVMILQNGPAPLNRLIPLSSIGGITQVTNNAALKALTASAGTVVYRSSFATPGDYGDGEYRFVASNCPDADDGGQVQPSSGGCWYLIPPAIGVAFNVWGAAQGANVDVPLKAAIAWACKAHTTILIPFPTSQYLLNSEIDLGDGSLAGVSTCNGVTLQGVQPYLEFFTPYDVAFGFNGSGGTIPFVVRGPAQGLNLKGIGVDCKGICSTGIKIINVANAEYGWLSVLGNIGPAFIVTSLPTTTSGLGMEGSHLHDWVAGFPSSGGSGMQLGDATCVTCNVATIADQFDNTTFNYDGNTAGTYGVQFGFVAQTTFTNLRIAPYIPGTLGAAITVAPPPGATGFPSDIVIYHSLTDGAIPDPGAGWTSPRGIRFDQFSTVSPPFNDPSTPYPVSTNYGQFWGVTDQGVPFPGPTPWTPTDASGAGLSLTVSNTFYEKYGNKCTIQFDITYPSTADASVSVIGGNPCVPLTGSANSTAGGAQSFTNLGTAVSVTCGQGTATCNFYDASGGGYTNGDLSGKNIRASLTYLTNP